MESTEIGYGALFAILSELCEGCFPDLIGDEVQQALQEVLSPKEAWSVAGILQDAIGAQLAERGETGIAERSSPFREV